MFDFEGNKTAAITGLVPSGELLVRKAQISDIESGVLLGRELHRDATVELMPFDRDKIERLAQGWVTSRSYNVLVAEEVGLPRHESWPASLREAHMRRMESTVGFFVGHRYRNPNSSDWLASDVSMFVRESEQGYLAAARMILQFIDWARDTGCSEVCLGSSSGYVIGKAGLDHEWLGLERLGPYYRARF